MNNLYKVGFAMMCGLAFIGTFLVLGAAKDQGVKEGTTEAMNKLVTLTCRIDSDKTVFSIVNHPVETSPPGRMELNATILDNKGPDTNVLLVITTSYSDATTTRAQFAVFDKSLEDGDSFIHAFYGAHPFAISITPDVKKCSVKPLTQKFKLKT